MAEQQEPEKEASSSNPAAALASDKDPSEGKLFIGGISWETTQDGLRYYFEKFGELSDVVLMKDRFTNQPRGFGFVTFSDASVVDRVLAETHTLDNKTVEVKKAVPRDRAPPPVSGGGASPRRSASGPVKKIFVGGLAPAVTEPEFRSYFEKYGKVTDAVVMYDRNTNRSRGFGFITFDEEDSVKRTMAEQHELSGKRVEIKRAEPREARPAPNRGGPPMRGGGRFGGGGGGGYMDRGRGGGGYGGGPDTYSRGYGYGAPAAGGYGYAGGYGSYGGGAAAAYGGGAGYGGGGAYGGSAPGGYSYTYMRRPAAAAGAGGYPAYSGGAPAASAGYEYRGGAGGRDAAAYGGAETASGFGPSSYGYGRPTRGTDRYRPY